MGLKQRQEREREAVTRAILDAARDLFVAEGFGNVSMRKIAERIEYSPPAIYSYFPSKDDIFFALAEEGFRMLYEQLNDLPRTEPLDDLRRAMWAFYQFSKAHPEHYSLMFVDRSVPRIGRDWERFGFVHEMQHQVALLVQAAIDAGALPPGTDAHAALLVLVASVHGAAALRLCDRIGAREDPDALVHDTLEAALAGLRSGIQQTFKAERPTADQRTQD